ncbi:MAG TPA: helix-turn-helix domain-containing protein [Candidatus Thermoplasmatota archaeon]|nr:helix-turn-helix domain-containing protein [Candidatus Thermoplasmatota archaeon]
MSASDTERLAYLFRLSAIEAKVLELLMHQGGVTAAQAAPVIGKSRSRAYEVLRGLVARGLATEEPGRPLRFRMRALRQALESLESELGSHSLLVKEALKTAHPASDEAQTVPPATVSLFKGRNAVEREVGRLVRAAGRSVFLASADPVDWGLLTPPPVCNALEAAARRGAEVRLFSGGGEAARALGRRVSAALPDQLAVRLETVRTPVACVGHESSVLYLLPGGGEPSTHRLAVRVDSEALAAHTLHALHTLGDADLSGGGPVETVEGFSDLYAQAVADASTEIANLAGPGWPALMKPLQRRRFREQFEAAALRGVRLKGIISDEPDELAFLRKVGIGSWEMRQTTALPIWVSIVDGVEMFQAVQVAATGQTLFRRTRDVAEVRFQRAVFQHLWQTAKPVKPG